MLNARRSDLIAVVGARAGRSMPAIFGEAWDAGAAVLPIDHRLTPHEVEAIIAAARPTIVLDGDEPARRAGEPVAHGVGLVIATSGSAGAPKIVELTHAAVGAAVAASVARLGARADEAWLTCLPLSHMGGLLCVLRATHLGARLVVHDGFDVDAFTAEQDIAFTALVPTMLHRLAAAGAALTPYRAILIGGAPASTLPPGPSVRTYGLTESCGGVVYDGIALDGVRVRIGSDSEIQLAGPTLMRRYRSDHTQPFTADGWLRTRDGGEIDPDGRLIVHGRLDDVIVTGGENVWPDEVEAALVREPGIKEAAVVGSADPEWGQIVVAHIVPQNPAAPPSLEDLRGSLELARHKLPRQLRCHEELRRLSSGKIDRAALR